MMIYHPIFQNVIVPDSREEIIADLEIFKPALQREYAGYIMAYVDCLEAALDDFRRAEDV